LSVFVCRNSGVVQFGRCCVVRTSCFTQDTEHPSRTSPAWEARPFVVLLDPFAEHASQCTLPSFLPGCVGLPRQPWWAVLQQQPGMCFLVVCAWLGLTEWARLQDGRFAPEGRSVSGRVWHACKVFRFRSQIRWRRPAKGCFGELLTVWAQGVGQHLPCHLYKGSSCLKEDVCLLS
jgi:hypothetical protein